MRGLTPEERRLLAIQFMAEQHWANEAEEETLIRLVSRGLVAQCETIVAEDDEWEEFETEWVGTELGALALRVCPIE